MASHSLIDFSAATGPRPPGRGPRDPAAPESVRRATLLAANDAEDPHILDRATHTVRYLIDDHLAPVSDMWRERDDTRVHAWATDDAERMRYRGRLDWRYNAAALAINATAGLGKSYAFLEAIGKRCVEHGHVTAAVLSPTHVLSKQSFRLFGKIMAEQYPSVDVRDFARVFIGVDEGCRLTCKQHGDKRPYNKRDFMAKCGMSARSFCKQRKNKDGEVTYPGCPYQEKCKYWKQFEGADQIRVWFHTHAAAKEGSLRTSGIKTRFDIVAIDENLLTIYAHEEKIHLDRLPVSESDSILQMVEEGTGVANSYAPEAVWVRAAMDEFVRIHKDGSDPGDDFSFEIRDGDASLIPSDELKKIHGTFKHLLERVLRADPSDFSFNRNGPSVKDHRTSHNKVSLKTLAKQREESEAVMLACELLLGFRTEGGMNGYSVDKDARVITMTCSGGFSDHASIYSSDDATLFRGSGRYEAGEYEQAWRDYEVASTCWLGRKEFIKRLKKDPDLFDSLNELQRIQIENIAWREIDEETGQEVLRSFNPLPHRPDFQYLGARMMYFDATLTPEVCDATLFANPDVVMTRNWSLQYVMVPYRPDLVRVQQVTGLKHSRKSYGVSPDNKHQKDENGQYIEPTEAELAEYKAPIQLERLKTVISYRQLLGDSVAAVVPMQVVPGNPASKHYVHKFDPVSYPGMEGATSAFMTCGSVAGRNGYEQANFLVVASQGFSESPRDHENVAIALTGYPVRRIGPRYPSDDTEEYATQGASQNYVPSSRPTHVDDLVEAIRWMSQEGQVIQSMDRARGVRRGRYTTRNGERVPECDEPLTILLCQRHLHGLPNTEFVSMRDIMPSQAAYLRAAGIETDDARQIGGRELLNSALPQVLQRADRTWDGELSDTFSAKASGDGWHDTVASFVSMGGRTCKVRLRTTEAGRERLSRIMGLKQLEVVTVASAEEHVLGILEACEAEGRDFILLKEVKEKIRGLTGAEKPPTSQKITQAIEALEQPRRFLRHKRKEGHGILIRPSESEADDV